MELGQGQAFDLTDIALRRRSVSDPLQPLLEFLVDLFAQAGVHERQRLQILDIQKAPGEQSGQLLVSIQSKDFQSADVTDLDRKSTVEGVVVEPNTCQRESAQKRRNPPAQPVLVRAELPQRRQVGELFRNGACKIVLVDPQGLERRQLAQLRWNPAGQLVVVEVQTLHRGEIAEFDGYRAGQVVPGNRQHLDSTQVAELRRYRARQFVEADVHVRHVGQVPQPGRYRT